MVFATGLYFLAILFYLQDRLGRYLLALLLLLFCREDMPFTIFAFGAVALWHRKWRFAASTMTIAAAWWLAVTFWIMPWLNGVGYFRHEQGKNHFYFRLNNAEGAWRLIASLKMSKKDVARLGADNR